MDERDAPAEHPGTGAKGGTTARPRPVVQGQKLRGADKTARIPVKVEVRPRSERLRKPKWIRASFPGTPAVADLKRILRSQGLHTVCEGAACPNLGECFGGGTATFMIMGDICTRRCPFCDVGHGRPNPLNPEEPERLAETIALMGLRYVVITSVDRDDLRDGGAGQGGEGKSGWGDIGGSGGQRPRGGLGCGSCAGYGAGFGSGSWRR